MEWVKRANDFLIRLDGGLAKWVPTIERWRGRFVSGVGGFFANADRTLLLSGIVVAVLAVIFWFSLRGREEL
jgi:hypothetical protein